MVEGGYCAKTCGRCAPTIRHYTMETFDTGHVKERGFTVAACTFGGGLPRSAQLRIILRAREEAAAGPEVAGAVVDEVAWVTKDDATLGYSVGRRGAAAVGEAVTMAPLLSATPGKANAEALTFGPLGPHWPGENPFLPRGGLRGTREASFKSNLPLAIVQVRQHTFTTPHHPLSLSPALSPRAR